MEAKINELMDIHPEDPAEIARKLEQSLAFLSEIAALESDHNPLFLASVRICHQLSRQLKT